MEQLTKERYKETLLRAEIISLLHDIGKLSWYFIGSGCKQIKYTDILKKHGINKKITDLRLIHTTEFLDRNFDQEQERDALQKRLREETGDWLSAVPGTPLAGLGSLLRIHHNARDFIDIPKDSSKDPYLQAFIMYADTADSLYSKGLDSANHLTQKNDIFLTSPFGTVQQSIDRQLVEKDARSLHGELAAALEGWQCWSFDTLVEKRTKIRNILRKYASRHLAETRLPNNDVSLWQHTSSVTAIFKALLAGYLLSGQWDNVLRNGELAHCNQRLSFLAFRWDTDAYMAHSLRSYEIVGRQAKLEALTNRIQKLVEVECCLGNKIYRDRNGICFLVPNIKTPKDASENNLSHQLLAEIHEQMETFCNREIIRGELPWSIHANLCNLQVGRFLDFWNNLGTPLFHGPKEPLWQKEWTQKADKHPQVCPRCGVHAFYPTRKEDEERRGSNSDIPCASCKQLKEEGEKKLDLYKSYISSDKKRIFETFLLEDDSSNSRVALIQGVFSLQALYGMRDGKEAPGWEHMLSPDDKDKSLKTVEQVLENWYQLQNALNEEEKEEKRIYFANLLGMSVKNFCTSADGWCSDATVRSRDLKILVEDVIRNLVFDKKLPDKENEKDFAARMILWGVRQHPAPSRLARVWEELGAFTCWASGWPRDREEADTEGADLVRGTNETDMQADWIRIPLTQDATSFQILVPAEDSWKILHDITTAYEARFGKVRHILPLHLSAGVFRRKAPLYIAMDAARRFRTLADTCQSRLWKLLKKSQDCEEFTRLTWETHDGRHVTWDVPRLLPNRDDKGAPREDLFRTWYFGEGDRLPTHLSKLLPGKSYRVWPSTFDFEVLDASVRRYDIQYLGERRPHYMMRGKGPRPYPLEIVRDWDKYLNPTNGMFKMNDDGKRQRKNAVEMLSHLHLDWDIDSMRASADTTPEGMMKDILCVTMPKLTDDLLPRTLDGSFFDLCEWADFITK